MRPSLELGLDRTQNPRQLLDLIFDTVTGRVRVNPHPKGKQNRGLNRPKLALVSAGARIAMRAFNSQFREPATHRW
jgi:hypothetical protein